MDDAPRRGLALDGKIPIDQPEERKHWGAVDVSRHRALQDSGVTLVIEHEGEDVTNRCIFADDSGVGFAYLYVKPLGGREWLVQERVVGIVIRQVDRSASHPSYL